MTTLPTYTKTIDNAFTHTWLEIQKEAADNIINANVVWAALEGAGCFKDQVGGEYISRTIRYAQQAATAIQRGDTLPSGETEVETMALWVWKTLATHVQRSMFDDQKNNGPSKIKDFVATKLKSAKDGLVTEYENQLHNAFQSSETGRDLCGLHNLVPPIASRTTGNFGNIARPTAFADIGNGVYAPSAGNTWWGAKYLAGTLASVEDDLLTDMKKLYNSIMNNLEAPNLIITTQTLFELYEEWALDASQIIKDESTRLADLGFEVLRFKGKPIIWTTQMTSNHMLMLNTNHIEVVKDPSYWFDMTDWKDTPLGTDRIAHIVSFLSMLTTQPRRHGRLEYA